MAQPILEAGEMHSEGYAGVRRTGTLSLVGLNPGCCPEEMDLVQKGEAPESFHRSVCVSICVSQTSLPGLGGPAL